MGLAEMGGKKTCPFPHVNEIPEHFFRVQIDRHKALLVVDVVLCLACGWLR